MNWESKQGKNKEYRECQQSVGCIGHGLITQNSISYFQRGFKNTYVLDSTKSVHSKNNWNVIWTQ